MPVPMSNLRAEYYSLKDHIDGAIQRVIESGSFVMGKELDAFEEELARYLGSQYVVGVGSGTAAIHLALLACGIGAGDEVITVPNTDIPTTMSISHCGARIVWVDVDPRTYNIDPARIEEKITPRTKAILPVHLFGHPADMDPIMAIAQEHGLLVIEDAALAVGAEYRGRKVGTIGDVGCFSLAPTKILGAYGDAGAVTTNNRDIADKVKVLRNYGFDLQMEEDRDPIGGHRFWRPMTEGFNERLDTLQAAILRAKLPTLDERIGRRRQAAQRYNQHLIELHLTTPHEAPEVKHVYRAYAILVKDRDRVREHLAAKGVATLLYYIPPLHFQPVYKRFGFGPGCFPVVEDLASRTLCLPIFPEITEEQTAEVVGALKECVPTTQSR